MKIDICIFLLMLIATIVYACGPQEHLAIAPVTSIPVIPPVLLVTRIPRPPSTVVVMTVSTPASAPAQIVIVPAPAPQAAPAVPAAPAAAAVPAAPAARGAAAAPAAGGAAAGAAAAPAAGRAAAGAGGAAAAPGVGGAAAAAGGGVAPPPPPQPPPLQPPPPPPAPRGGAGPFGRKKRSVDLIKMKKCRSAEFDVFMDHKNMSEETSEIVKKLELKIESTQKIFNNTMNKIEIESVRREKLRLTYKVEAECNSVRHVLLDALVEIKTIQSIVIKCECQPSLVMFKNDFKVK